MVCAVYYTIERILFRNWCVTAATHAIEYVLDEYLTRTSCATGSTVDVHLTLSPTEPYSDYPYNNDYAWGATKYNAEIFDSKYKTSCFASFAAIPDEETTGYSKYYYRGAAGFLLLGVATFVTMKRKVICACDNRQTGGDGDEGHYNATQDDSASIYSESQLT